MALQPIINPDRGWTLWKLSQIYLGTQNGPVEKDSNRFVPNVGDWVVDKVQGYKEVVAVNELIPVMQSFQPPGSTGEDNEDSIVASPLGAASVPYRIHVDDSILPIRFNIDSRFTIHGSAASHYKVFKGTDIGPTGHVISATVNSAGVPTGENIAVELVAIKNVTNIAIKAPKPGYLSEQVAHGELCTIVVYSQAGDILDWAKLVVWKTPYVRSTDASRRFIRSIALETPFLSPDDNTLIEVPINLLLKSTMLMGVINYSDGLVSRIAINGSKFSLPGLESFTATSLGQTSHVDLVYTLASDEYAYDTTAPLPSRSMVKEYRIRTVEADGAYSAKVYLIPVWNSATSAWKLTFWLYNMNRDAMYNITDLVEISTGYEFNGKAYNQAQEIRFAINLQNLGSSFKYYRHIQSAVINLTKPGAQSDASSFWTIKYSNTNSYGLNLIARKTADATNVGRSVISVANGEALVENWLDRTYRSVEPIYFVHAESIPVNPTHVRVHIPRNNFIREIAIADILKPIDNISASLVQGDNVQLEFIAKTSDQVLELAMSSMTLSVIS